MFTTNVLTSRFLNTETRFPQILFKLLTNLMPFCGFLFCPAANPHTLSVYKMTDEFPQLFMMIWITEIANLIPYVKVRCFHAPTSWSSVFGATVVSLFLISTTNKLLLSKITGGGS